MCQANWGACNYAVPREAVKNTAQSGIMRMPHMNMTEAVVCLVGDCSKTSDSYQRVPIDMSQPPTAATQRFHDNSVTVYVSCKGGAVVWLMLLLAVQAA